MTTPRLIPLLALAVAALSSAPAQSPATNTLQVGDRILLTVENEPTLTDTFNVTPELSVILPTIGEVSVANVRRDQVTEHFTNVLSKFLRSPTVRALALIRVFISGEVLHPGYYYVPADLVITDALMIAGGPTPLAKVKDMRIERNGKRVAEGDKLRKAIGDGATFSQLNVRAGDELKVPRGTPKDTETIVRILAMVVTVPLAILAMTRR